MLEFGTVTAWPWVLIRSRIKDPLRRSQLAKIRTSHDRIE